MAGWQIEITKNDGSKVTDVQEAEQALLSVFRADYPDYEPDLEVEDAESGTYLANIPTLDPYVYIDLYDDHEYANDKYTVIVPGL